MQADWVSMNANKIYFVCEPLRSVKLLRDLFPETFIYLLILPNVLRSLKLLHENRTMVWFSTARELFDPEIDRFAVFSPNWRQLKIRYFMRREMDNTVKMSTSTFNSSRTVENQTMVLFWLSTGLKFQTFWYINHCFEEKSFSLN